MYACMKALYDCLNLYVGAVSSQFQHSVILIMTDTIYTLVLYSANLFADQKLGALAHAVQIHIIIHIHTLILGEVVSCQVSACGDLPFIFLEVFFPRSLCIHTHV